MNPDAFDQTSPLSTGWLFSVHCTGQWFSVIYKPLNTSFHSPFLVIRGGRGVPGVAGAESRCPGVDEGEKGSSSERGASQSSAGQTTSSFQSLSQRHALRAAARILQPDGRGAQEGATAEVQTCC